CLVTAGLMAEGTTTIYNVEYILRGYDHIIEKLTALGADIQMLETEEQEGPFEVDQ
ncbi:MAG: UDP-N-acetylglucosamine 1-carboxyvinyltransferase, partial [Enterococcus faecalis]|nr:UDP-N-acetylglucosamine 1-carboxyvinyltransferase [Enterococcus faecalis]